MPALRPLSPMQLTAVALLADGFDAKECARLMGVEISTFDTHLREAAHRLPGDFRHIREKVLAWYRGGTAAVLGVDHVVPPRQEALTRAYSISVGQACGRCGYLSPHGTTEHTAGGRGHP